MKNLLVNIHTESQEKYKKYNCCIILDQYKKCDLGLSFYIPLSKFLKKTFKGNLNKCYFVDAPKIFKILFKIIYFLMDKDTRDKVIFIKKKHEGEIEIVNHVFL